MYEIDPLRDPRWSRFLERHDAATVFHSPEWLAALHRTHGYQIGALTTSPQGSELRDGLVFCRVRSWLTGPRVVSLPFSDHCAPLVESEESLACLLAGLKQGCDSRKGMYLEIRGIPAGDAAAGLAESAAFCLHRLDLRPDLDAIRLGLHANCVRRKIARAERESLVYEEGQSEALLRKFYTLAVLTRRRHRLPPHPVAWFRNLIECLGDGLQIRVASHKGRPAAAILTLRYKHTMTYKYGASDSRLHNLGATQLLLWSAIQEAKRDGMLEFDLGRTEWGNEGLLVFKDRWGAARFPIAYLRYPAPAARRNVGGAKIRIARQIFALAPARLLTTAGNVLYRHMA